MCSKKSDLLASRFDRMDPIAAYMRVRMDTLVIKARSKMSDSSEFEFESDEMEFLDACRHGRMDVIDRLIDEVDINCQEPDGWSGLMLVCENNEPWVLDIVQKLLSHGIDVDIEDDYCYYTALDCALGQREFNKELAALLLCCSKLGVNRLDVDGQNYLWGCRSKESLLFLIENGIDINHVDDSEETYLDTCNEEHYDFLLAAGAKHYDEL